jgi:PAS domain S-box-containing protein
MKKKLTTAEIRQKTEELFQSVSVESGSKLAAAKDLMQQMLNMQSELEEQNRKLIRAETEFYIEREYYNDIFNNQPAGLYRIRVTAVENWEDKSWANSDNPPYEMEFASDRFCQIIGVSPKDFKKNPYIITDVVHPEDTASFVARNEEANIKYIPFRWEGRLIVRKKIVWVRLESVPRKLDNGDIIWTGILYDITERKNAENELDKTRIQLEDVITGANLGTLEWNIQTGQIKFNDIWAQNLGLSKVELKLGSKLFGANGWKLLTHPDDIPYADEMLKRHFAGELPYHIVEVRMRHKKGHWVWMRQVGKVKTWTPDGKPMLMYGIHTNIDDRKKTEIELSSLNDKLEARVQIRTAELEKLNAELLQSEQKFKTISDFTYDWEYWKSPENKILFMSPSVLRITGYSIDEFLEDSELLDNIVYKNDVETWQKHKLVRSPNSNSENSMELTFRIVSKKGEIRWMGHICRSIFMNGTYLGVRVSNRDITEKVNAENELLAVTVDVEERERNRFSRELHDGMGPLLSTVKLYFQWLSENEDAEKRILITEKGNQCIEAAIQTSRELARGLNSQLLVRSGYVIAIQSFIRKINDTGKIKINFNSNVNTIFNQFIEITLYRITTELLKNTLTYAGAEQVEINFDFDKINSKINFTYSDNGTGFDYEFVKKTNTGLGLMNIQQRVQVLKGEMKIESEIGKGMKANVRFPVEDTMDSGLGIE